MSRFVGTSGGGRLESSGSDSESLRQVPTDHLDAAFAENHILLGVGDLLCFVTSESLAVGQLFESMYAATTRQYSWSGYVVITDSTESAVAWLLR